MTTTMNREQITQQLQSNSPCSITYTGEDGQQRTRRGTLNESLMPSSASKQPSNQQQQSTSSSQQQGSNVTYFDLDQNEWRSFSIDRLQSISQSQS